MTRSLADRHSLGPSGALPGSLLPGTRKFPSPAQPPRAFPFPGLSSWVLRVPPRASPDVPEVPLRPARRFPAILGVSPSLRAWRVRPPASRDLPGHPRRTRRPPRSVPGLAVAPSRCLPGSRGLRACPTRPSRDSPSRLARLSGHPRYLRVLSGIPRRAARPPSRSVPALVVSVRPELDWPSETDALNINVPRDREGYDGFEYTDEKLSTRRIQW